MCQTRLPKFSCWKNRNSVCAYAYMYEWVVMWTDFHYAVAFKVEKNLSEHHWLWVIQGTLIKMVSSFVSWLMSWSNWCCCSTSMTPRSRWDIWHSSGVAASILGQTRDWNYCPKVFELFSGRWWTPQHQCCRKQVSTTSSSRQSQRIPT